MPLRMLSRASELLSTKSAFMRSTNRSVSSSAQNRRAHEWGQVETGYADDLSSSDHPPWPVTPHDLLRRDPEGFLAWVDVWVDTRLEREPDLQDVRWEFPGEGILGDPTGPGRAGRWAWNRRRGIALFAIGVSASAIAGTVAAGICDATAGVGCLMIAGRFMRYAVGDAGRKALPSQIRIPRVSRGCPLGGESKWRQIDRGSGVDRRELGMASLMSSGVGALAAVFPGRIGWAFAIIALGLLLVGVWLYSSGDN